MLAHLIGYLRSRSEPDPQPLASLGAWGHSKKEKSKPKRAAATIEEALPPEVVSRLREQMLSASLTADVIARAKARVRQQRNNTVALLLMV